MIDAVFNEVLDKKEAAAYLRVSPITVERRAREGVIGTKVGSLWRFTMSELRDYAAGRLPCQQQERGAENEQIQAGNARAHQNGSGMGLEA